MRGNFSAQLFEVVCVQSTQMFAEECHFVSVEKQFDKAALLQ